MSKIKHSEVNFDQLFCFVISRPSTLERVGVLTPEEVGRETVAGIRNGSKYVCVPRYYILLGKFFQ